MQVIVRNALEKIVGIPGRKIVAHYTFGGLPVVITRASNNYGPYQFPEKLIPLMIANALEDEPLPVYGDGIQVRDWLYVEDHCCGPWPRYSTDAMARFTTLAGIAFAAQSGGCP